MSTLTAEQQVLQPPLGFMDIKPSSQPPSGVTTPAPISMEFQQSRTSTPPMYKDMKVVESNHLKKEPQVQVQQSVSTPENGVTPTEENPQPVTVVADATEIKAVAGVKVDVAADTQDESIPPPPLTLEEKAEKILNILERYRMNTASGVFKAWSGRDKVRTQIETCIKDMTIIEMVLPAFPFKSPNKADKVLGTLPDKAEEVALQHLHGLCVMVEEVHAPGARINIVSDGLMYNDLLGVSDLEVWRYGQTLRAMREELGCTNVNFLRLKDLLGREYAEPLNEEVYLRDAPSFRSELHDNNLPKGFDVSTFINNDADAVLTYRGYIKFLEKDLANHDSQGKNKKRYQEEIAKKMMSRGKAFAAAIASRFGHFVRLSIHASSSDASKLSVSLVPQKGSCSMTPWHSSLVRGLDGSITMSHAIRVPAMTHDLVYENGRPSYFREKSDLFHWPGMDVTFNYMYPTGIMIRPADPTSSYSIHNVHMQKVRGLAEHCSPIVLRGFKDANDRRTFIAKAYDAGEVQPWTFGVMAEVKDIGRKDRMANNVSSSEAMPMHFDGMFKYVKKTNPETGEEESVPAPPRFQYFTAKTPSPPGSGYTLFASSRLLFQHLPHPHTAEELSALTYECKNSGFWDFLQTKQPLVVPHPAKGTPCVRWHEPWPQWKTKFANCKIRIENGSQDYIKLVDSLLYDRRVCLYFVWEKGDVLVNDNFGMLHTRTAFVADTDRELWRIHFD